MLFSNIMSQKADVPLSEMPHSGGFLAVFLPNNFLFTAGEQILQNMGATLTVVQTARSNSPELDLWAIL